MSAATKPDQDVNTMGAAAELRCCAAPILGAIIAMTGNLLFDNI